MPKKPFDKDIELAKLQNQLSAVTTAFYSMITICVTAVIFFAATGISGVLGNLPGSESYAIIAFVMILFIVVMMFYFKSRYEKMTAKTYLEFENIYNSKRIDDSDMVIVFKKRSRR